MRFSITKHISEGCVLPRGYGLAWYIPAQDGAVVLPIPLNLIARWVREGWLRLKFPKMMLRDENAILRRRCQVLEEATVCRECKHQIGKLCAMCLLKALEQKVQK